MHHAVDVTHGRVHRRPVPHVATDDLEPRPVLTHQGPLLRRRPAFVSERPHAVARRAELAHRVLADVAEGAGDEDVLGGGAAHGARG